MHTNIFIVIVNYNGLQDTRKCLDSIKTIPEKYVHVLVVDNASHDDPSEVLQREFSSCIVLRSASNEGWAGGNNRGILHALGLGAEYVILLNNDTIVSSELVSRLLHAARRHPEFGVIGPVINEMNEPAKVQTDGCLFNRAGSAGFFQRKFVPHGQSYSPAITEVDIVNGCCIMISKRVFAAIGLMDERFFLVHEESDFCLRAREAGFRCGVIGEPLVWHKHSASFIRTGNWRQRYYDCRNLFLLLRKHPPGQHNRPKYQSWIEYMKYIYYSYCLEKEQDSPEGTHAVVQGLCDAILSYFGPHVLRNSLGCQLTQMALETAWRWRGNKATPSLRGAQ